MPPPRSKTTVPVGTGKFISLERKTAAMFRKQEVDDFTYAVQNDRDWLEEHVRQIFTDINRIGQKRLHDLFKTPAKLRFKTPKTILTLEELVAREPLSESFAPNRSSPTKNHKGGQKQKKADALQESDAIGEHKNSSPLRKKDKKRGKKNPAHGSDVAVDAQSSAQPSLAPSVAARATSALEALPSAAQSGSITADKASFCSSMPSPSFEISAVEPKTNPVSVIRQSIGSHPKISEINHSEYPSISDFRPHLEATHSSSIGSSPVKPVVRKSSLSFAALPAREPLGSKTSFGGRTSHLDNTIMTDNVSAAVMEWQVGINASTDAQLQDIAVYGDREPMNLDEHHPAATAGSASDDLTSQLHRKASTQRLHERISQLGQFQVPPPSKSLLTQAIQAERSRSPEAVDPGLAIHPYQKPTADKHGGKNIETLGRGPLFVRPTEVPMPSAVLGPAGRRRSPSAVSAPSIAVDLSSNVLASTTGLFRTTPPYPQPAAELLSSQYRRQSPNEPVSASKAKFSSLLKSARGIFASSAGVSAQAKMETMSPSTGQFGKESTRRPIPLFLGDVPRTTTRRSRSPDRLAEGAAAPLPVPVRTQDFPRAQASDKARGSDGKVAQHLLIDDACASDGTEIRHPRDGSGGTVIHHLTDDACGSGGSEIRHPRDGSGGTVIHHLTDDACASGGTEIHHPRDASGGTVIHHLTEDACGSGDTVIHQPRSFGILILGTSSNKAPELDAMTSTLNEGALPDGLLCHPHPENVVRDPDPLVESQHSANVLVSYESTAKAVSQAPSEAQIDPKTAFSTAQTTTKRSAKPKQPITKAKPAPVAIKVGTASQRERDNRKANPPAMTLALQKSIGPSAGPSSKPARPLPTPLQKASASSTSKGSTSALHPPKPRALAAAARKKEQDEREAQRRLDTKREFERKKLAQQEAQKQDLQRERQTELQQRTNTKNDAKRKGEDDDTGRPTKKMQANRERPGPVVNESGNGPARHAIHKDGMERGAQPEADFENHLGPIEDRLGAIEQRRQQLAKNGAGQGRVHFAIDVAAPRMNPARPAKRGPQVEESDARVQDAGLKRGRSYVLTEGKRRKTITDDEVEPRQQTLQPPVRQNLRKLPTATSGTGGFSSLFKTTTMAQLQQQHSSQTAARALPPSTGDMAKFASAMIPFAEPSQGSMSAAASGLLAPKGASSRAGPHRGGDMARFADAKIPFAEGKGGVGSAAVGLSTGLELVPRPPTQLAMSQENLQELHLLYQKQRQEEAARREKMGLEHDSPQAAHGSDITLPSIHEGDSQEDDEWPEEAFDDHDNADGLNTHPLALLRQLENGGKPPSKKKFVAPEWAHSPNLAQILKTQQLVEPDMVFGPMQQLDMDEIFAGHPPLPPAPAAKGRGGAAKRTTAEQSSPKWTAEELITPEEIAKDWEARKLLKDKGEWEYGMGH